MIDIWFYTHSWIAKQELFKGSSNPFEAWFSIRLWAYCIVNQPWKFLVPLSLFHTLYLWCVNLATFSFLRIFILLSICFNFLSPLRIWIIFASPFLCVSNKEMISCQFTHSMIFIQACVDDTCVNLKLMEFELVCYERTLQTFFNWINPCILML